MPMYEGAKPWEGRYNCTELTNGGLPCSNKEIDGLGFCFYHVPEDMLDEAEEITGLIRCRHDSGCPRLAKEGTVPPRCTAHGANEGSHMSKQAAGRVVEEQVMARFEAIMTQDGERLLNPQAIGDPFTELLALAAEMKELKQMLLEVVSVMKPNQWRYRGKDGEQARAELILLERAQERLERCLVNLIKLKIEDRLAGVEERTLEMMERAMDMAMTAGIRAALASNGDELEGQQEARKVLRRELPVLAS
jgi:hypothetical protein